MPRPKNTFLTEEALEHYFAGIVLLITVVLNDI